MTNNAKNAEVSKEMQILDNAGNVVYKSIPTIQADAVNTYVLNVSPAITTPGTYTLVIPEGFVRLQSGGLNEYEHHFTIEVVAPIVAVSSVSDLDYTGQVYYFIRFVDNYHMHVNGNAYKYINRNGSKPVYKNSSYSGVEAQMLFCLVPGSESEPPTGIEGPDAEDGEQYSQDNVIYDLSGRRVQRAEKGIYVVNGKKIMIK